MPDAAQFDVLLASATSAAHAGELARAWQLFGQFQHDVGHSRAAASAFSELLTSDPSYPDALIVAERIVGGFGTDPSVIIPLSAALLRVAELRPSDEPPFDKGPAHLAAGACQRCFEALDGAQRMDAQVGGYLQVNMADGLRMMGPDHDEDALNAYKVALAIDGTRGAWWFHLGLFYKWRGRFREGLEANQKAFARLGPQRPVLWNLALCATALGEGKLALEAWEKLGIRGELSSAGMPFVPDMPPMQVRVATLGEETGQGDPLPQRAVTFEVLWVQPLSPCHGVLQSPTARKASVDYGDVVLWDGAPVRMNRVTTADGHTREVPVFPLLWILRLGDERRLRLIGMQKQRGMVQALAGRLAQMGDTGGSRAEPKDASGSSARDPSAGVELVVYDERSSTVADAQHLFYGKLIVPAAVELQEVARTLESELRARPGLTIAVPQLYEQLGVSEQAGKAHQAWGGIERLAEKQGILSRTKR